MRLDIEDVSIAVASRCIVNDVNLAVGSGELVGLIGPNGSGKSTLLRSVYRALTPTHGAIRLDGQDVAPMSIRDSARSLAAVPQDSRPEFDFTCAEIVAMGRHVHQNAWGGLSARDKELITRALRQVDATHLANQSFLTVSGGERQRVLIARVLAQEPRVLVLDEPTNHLDVRHQLELLTLVRDIGITTLTALHDLNLAATYCDRLYVLDAGRVVAFGSPSDVLTSDLLTDVFGIQAVPVRHPHTGATHLLFSPAPARRLAPAPDLQQQDERRSS